MTLGTGSPTLAALRVDTVGSLLRPDYLKDAYVDRDEGRSDDEALASAQDTAVREVVAAQDAHGLPVVTDGEFRRFNFMESFAEVAGMGRWKARWTAAVRSLAGQKPWDGPPRQGVNPVLLEHEPVTERLRLIRSNPGAEYAFAQPLTSSPVKISLINPDRIAQSVDLRGSRHLYADADELVADIVAIQREMIGGLRSAGCEYVHIDAPGYTAYVDPASLARMEEQGQDAHALLDRAIDADNALIAGYPDLTFGLHMCRGNRHSQWHREGRYDAIAERLFSGLNHHRLLLEYDDERAGDFKPLRFVPKGKVVVLGLITTKTSRLESKDKLRSRIDEAARYLPLDQLALSPQCGFASDVIGNAITEDAQWRKLDLMLEVAAETWGSA